MTIETEIASLTQSTTDLLEAVNIKKAVLDNAVSTAAAAAEAAAASEAAAEAAAESYAFNSIEGLKETDAPLGTLCSLDDGGVVRWYKITNSATFPRIALTNGLYAARLLEGASLCVMADDWELVSGELAANPSHAEGIAKYTDDQYDIAYNNGNRISQMYTWCNANGVTDITFEPNRYAVCYSFSGSGFSLEDCAIDIYECNDLNISGKGVEIYVIYDSLNYSKYYTNYGANKPTDLPGAVLSIRHSKNITIGGFKIIGDKYQRSYFETINGVSNYPDSIMEHTHGIFIGKANHNIKIIGNDISGFMGDCINGDKWAYYVGSKSFNLGLDAPKGGLGTNGEELVDDGSGKRRTPIFIPLLDNQDLLPINNTVFIWGDYSAQRSRTIKVCYYNELQEFIFSETNEDFNFFILPPNAYYLKIEFLSIDSDEVTVDLAYRLFTGFSNTISVLDNVLHNTNRGGISNLGHDCTIENNRLSDTGGGGAAFNGFDKYGHRVFPTNTRYCVNLEDFHYNSLTVKANTFSNYYSGVLSFVKKLNCKDNTFNGGVTVSVGVYYPTKHSFINNNTIVGAVSYPVYTRKYHSSHTLTNNTITGNFLAPNGEFAKYKVSNNTFYDCNVEVSDGMEFKDNSIIATGVKLDSAMRFRLHSIYGEGSEFGKTYAANGNIFDVTKEDNLFAYGNIGLDVYRSIPWKNTYRGLNLASTQTGLFDWGLSRALSVDGLSFIDCNTVLILAEPPYEGQSEYNVNIPATYIIKDLKHTGTGTVGLGPYVFSSTRRQPTCVFELSNLDGAFYIKDNRKEISTEPMPTHYVTLKNSRINVTNMSHIFSNPYTYTTNMKNYVLKFNNCTFYNDSDVKKEFKLCKENAAWFASLTSVATDCKFINCENIDNATTLTDCILL